MEQDFRQWNFNQDASLPIDAGDTLTVLGPAHTIERSRKEGCSGQTAGVAQ